MIMAVKEEFTVEISAYEVEKAVISDHLIDNIAAPIHKPNEIPIVARINPYKKGCAICGRVMVKQNLEEFLHRPSYHDRLHHKMKWKAENRGIFCTDGPFSRAQMKNDIWFRLNKK